MSSEPLSPDFLSEPLPLRPTHQQSSPSVQSSSSSISKRIISQCRRREKERRASIGNNDDAQELFVPSEEQHGKSPHLQSRSLSPSIQDESMELREECLPLAHPSVRRGCNPSTRALGQRRRRQSERAARVYEHQPASIEQAPSRPLPRRGTPSTRALGQRRRRQSERSTRMQFEQTPIDPLDTVEDDPVARRPYVEPANTLSFGGMNVTCNVCAALHWMDERIRASSKSAPRFSRCCHQGKVRLDPLPEPPNELRKLFTLDSTEAKEFRESIRQYNSALAFTSFTSKEKYDNSAGDGPWVWKSRYTIYHRAGVLFPDADNNPRYAQLYFYDPDDALHYRMNRNKDLNPDTMEYLQNMLHDINRYERLFFHSFEVLQTTPSRDLAIAIVADPSKDLRRYNAPIVDEIAVVLPGDQSHALDPRDIILHYRGDPKDLKFIHDHHHAYAPLHYVLLFPYGTPGWTYGLPLQSTPNAPSDDVPEGPEPDVVNEKHMTQVQFYSYRLHTRQNEFPIIQYGGRLFQQYTCDIWISTDQNRLRWIENNQPHLRAALYSGLEDTLAHGERDLELDDIGHRVVLPSSYIGGPRYMNQRFQDAIAVARYYHGFDLFITFTSNSQWPDINAALLPGQTAAERPDIIVRVFNMYKTSLIDELRKQNIFGTTLGYVYTIEFQKRGLPHMHLLLSLSPRFRPTTPEQVDSIIRATWPDPEREPHLFNIVKRRMVHGPCGPAKPNAPCMKDGVCSKGFPKPFQAETVMSRNGYPTYARPNDGRAYKVGNVFVDNRWIVPYNPYLLSRYDAHINVECVMSLAAAKYITKYTHKGPDRATLEIQQRDEVAEFRDSRYIAASEATWRLFELPIHHQEPAVVSLQIHLPGQHMVVFKPDEPIETVTARAEQERTMLTAFFHLNRNDPDAHKYTYQELPEHFVWDRPKKQWKPRQRGSSIGRIYFVSPTAGERFYLRTLLTTVKGPTSWEDLRTFDNVLHPTFHAACLARGLLENDDEWRQCLTEASLTHIGESLRHLFSLILRHCQPSEPHVLWEEFRDNLCDDLAHRLRRARNTVADIPLDEVYDFGLFLIDQDLAQNGISLSSFPSMPTATRNWDDCQENPYMLEQLAYNCDDETRLAEQSIPSLNKDQSNAFDEIFAATSAQEPKIFFLHGAGGTGKTYLYHTLCHRVRGNGWIVLCVASSGIAALLLPGGHTAYFTFSIPVENLAEDSICQVDKNSKQADMFRKVRLIIWDEAVMQHRHAVEAVDRMLQDICSTTQSFGGITVVFGGDFQQTLPIVVNGSQEDVIQATLQRSMLWTNVKILHLRQNMRLNTTNDPHSFAQWLLDIGHGRSTNTQNPSTSITVPDGMLCRSESDLIASVYGSMTDYHPVPPLDYFRERAILTATNKDVRTLNSTILDHLPGDERIYDSADSYSIESPTPHENNNLPIEFLNNLNASGLPIAHLHLKIGCPIIILRNIDSKRGLCNGTRASILHMSNRLLEVRLITGDHAGETALIPRITLSPSVTGLDFAIKLNRRQFPIQLAFAMTINKAQGQTVKHIGIDLRRSVFSHGQLYVAFSRATTSKNIKVLLARGNKTKNVIYKQVLLD